MKLILQISAFIAIFWEATSKIPDLSYNECPENMIAFFDDRNFSRQICDCDNTFLYHSENDSCYNAYRQGPCPSGHYFVLPQGEMVAKCEKNPCEMDGLVPYQGNCHILWNSGEPCENNATYLGINDDFQIECSSRKYPGNLEKLKTSKSCPENSYLHSVNTSFVCQCKDTFVFLEKNNSCHRAYRQGPCLKENYLIVPPGENGPKCEKNPCHEDGLVPFEGGCHKAYKTGRPCPDNLHILSVTKDNFALRCISLCSIEYIRDMPACSVGGRKDFVHYTHMFGGGIIKAPFKVCPPGSRRIFSGECKRQYF